MEKRNREKNSAESMGVDSVRHGSEDGSKEDGEDGEQETSGGSGGSGSEERERNEERGSGEASQTVRPRSEVGSVVG
jgi:hypothetical protein